MKLYEDTSIKTVTDVMRQVILGNDEDLRIQFGDSVEEWMQQLGNHNFTDSAIYDFVDILENHGIECGPSTIYKYLVDIGAVDESDIEPEYKRYQDSECLWVGKYRDKNGKYCTVTFLGDNDWESATKQFYEELPEYYKDEYLVGRTK